MLRPDDDSREFTGYGRYIIAGFGAVSSLVAPLIIVDIEIIASSLQVAFASDFSGVWLIIGYFIRFSALVGAGVFWVWAFNRREYNAWKLFQLGVVAPAILSGAAQSAKRDDLLDAAQQVQQSSYLFFSPAFAQESDLSSSEPSPSHDLPWWKLIKSGIFLEPLDDPIERLVQQTREIKGHNAALREELSSLADQSVDLININEQLKDTITNLEAMNQELRIENQTLTVENQNLIAEVLPTAAREEELEEKIAELEREMRSLVAQDEPEVMYEELRLKPQVAIVELWELPKIAGALGYGSLEASTFERGEDLDMAMSYYQSLAELAENDRYLLGVAAAYANMAVVARLKEDDEETVARYEQRKVDVLRSIGREETGMISTYEELGVTEELKGSLEDAREYHLKALELAQQEKFEWGAGSAYLNLGVISYMDKAMKESEEFFMQALEAFGQTGTLGNAMTYSNLAVLYEATGREKLALEYKDAAEGALQSLKR